MLDKQPPPFDNGCGMFETWEDDPMKKTIGLILAFAMACAFAFALVGCGGGSSAIEKYVKIDGAYWRNAFENPDYSEFADDEERELFVFVTVRPDEKGKLQVGGYGSDSKNNFVSLQAGNQHKIDSLGNNYTNFYYQPMKDAGYKIASMVTAVVEIKPIDEPITFASQFWVEGWEIKGADHVTLKIENLYLDGKPLTGDINIPLDSIRPVVVDSEGQPTHTAMIEKMVEMAQQG